MFSITAGSGLAFETESGPTEAEEGEDPEEEDPCRDTADRLGSSEALGRKHRNHDARCVCVCVFGLL